MTPSRPADAAVKAGRWAKAQSFADAAELHRPTNGLDDDGRRGDRAGAVLHTHPRGRCWRAALTVGS